MTYKDILKRACATFIAGAAAAPVAGPIVGVAALTAFALAGLVAVFNLFGRLAQKWLTANPEDSVEFVAEHPDEVAAAAAVGEAVEKALRTVLATNMQQPS